MKNLTLTIVALASVLVLAPLSGAQTPQTPPVAETPAAPPAPGAPQVQSPAPAPSVAPTPAAQTQASNTRSCRTRKEVGEACACLSAPDQVGAVQAATDGGRNMCVVPAQ